MNVDNEAVQVRFMVEKWMVVQGEYNGMIDTMDDNKAALEYLSIPGLSSVDLVIYMALCSSILFDDSLSIHPFSLLTPLALSLFRFSLLLLQLLLLHLFLPLSLFFLNAGIYSERFLQCNRRERNNYLGCEFC